MPPRLSRTKNSIPEPEYTPSNGGIDNDSPSVSLVPSASVEIDSDTVIFAEWGRRGSMAEDFALLHAPAPASKPLGDRPKPSKRQKRTHELVRGAETRAVRTRSKDIYTGDVPLTRLNGKLVSGEGLHEVLGWIVIEFLMDDMVAAYAQADMVKIFVFGKPTDWTPDVRIVRKDKPDLLIEVKPLEQVQPNEKTPPDLAAAMREKVRARQAYADANGFDFLLLTDFEIRKEPRFHNAKVMFRALGSHIGEQAIADVFQQLHHFDEIGSVSDPADALPQYRNVMLMIACMLDRAGYIRLDREEFFHPGVEFENYLSSPELAAVGPTGKETLP